MECRKIKLHSPVFVGGKNFSTELDAGAVAQLKLEHVEEKHHFTAEFGGEMIRIPETNVSSWSYVDDPGKAPKPGRPTSEQAPATTRAVAQAAPARAKVKAQVSDPTRDAVFGKGN
jgi:hypothetical protein